MTILFDNPGDEATGNVERLAVWNLQSRDHRFQPRFSNQGTGELDEHGFSASAYTSGTDALHSDDQNLEQMLADAYAKGFAEAEKLKDATIVAEQQNADKLQQAVMELKPQSDALISTMLLKCVRSLTQQVIGRSEPDTSFLEEQTAKLGGLIQEGMQNAILHLHPDDLALLGEFDAGVKMTTDPGLMRGTLRLVHGDGWIERGSEPLIDELQAMLDEMEQAQ